MKTNPKSILKSIYLFLVDNFHQSQSLEYRLLKRAYLLYQHEVLKQSKTFEIYVRDYLAEIHNFNYATSKELVNKTRIHTKVSDIFIHRPDLIKQYFDLQRFDFKAYKQLIKDNTSSIVQEQIIDAPYSQEQPQIDNLEEKLAKVKAEILKYESGEKQPKHIGQRMFGYLLKANYLNAYNDEQRLEAWKEFTGLEQRPEMSFLRDPNYNKNETIKINQQLKQIEEFFYLIGLDIPITYHEKKK